MSDHADPIGTVRQCPIGRHTVIVRTYLGAGRPVWVDPATGTWWVELPGDWPVIGAVPGTPADTGSPRIEAGVRGVFYARDRLATALGRPVGVSLDDLLGEVAQLRAAQAALPTVSELVAAMRAAGLVDPDGDLPDWEPPCPDWSEYCSVEDAAQRVLDQLARTTKEDRDV